MGSMTESLDLPAGFQCAGLHCGIKSNASKFDLSLFVSDRSAVGVGVFTQNKVVGAPVKVSRARTLRDSSRAIVINSGNSNACTGDRGLEDARWMTQLVANGLGCAEEDVMVCSTGIIGHFLNRDALAAGIPAAVEQLAHGAEAYANAAKGIMTTDTFAKQSVRNAEIGGANVRVSGCAKGAAMIGPNMATMLAVVMTDAAIDAQLADSMLRSAVNKSFNCISVEGHTSTSDSVILLANGAAGNTALDDHAAQTLQQMLGDVCIDLAKAIVRDAEGAEHFVVVDVQGLATPDDARKIAKAIVDGPLVKTAITGNDPNWGRIVSAAGYAGVDIREEDTTLSINGVTIYESGTPTEYNEQELSNSMRDVDEVHIQIAFNYGDCATRFWTSDLTAEYVRLNSEYTT